MFVTGVMKHTINIIRMKLYTSPPVPDELISEPNSSITFQLLPALSTRTPNYFSRGVFYRTILWNIFQRIYKLSWQRSTTGPIYVARIQRFVIHYLWTTEESYSAIYYSITPAVVTVTIIVSFRCHFRIGYK